MRFIRPLFPGNSPVHIFFLGALVGMFSFWILDIRRSSEQLIVRNIYDFDDYVKPQKFHNDPETGHHEGEDILAADLAKKVRVFVFVLTSPRNKMTKAIPVKTTWARRFDGYLFISSENDKDLPAIPEIDKYDYFMKADDDTFVIVENLRYLLAGKNPNEPFLMGRRFKVIL
ncbi:unnamed protein product [Hymenolepis diminuta]|uniref:Hexosyltransferase n=1 Tax=Hymenolepis diminuta TaxID=6216 RepID=A0A0R3SH29_HYMDI|nr:unnamed protein product [Hymenolepis diminuta]